ncbi:MAG: hypothetical protein RR945_07535 [Erysipelotrichaceae bacterium]
MKHRWSHYLFAVIIFVIMIMTVIYGLNTSDEAAKQKELEQIQSVVQKSMSECYAMEGRYPKDFDYLQKHYHIRINKDRYHVYYQYQGDNIVPSIDIIEKE